jgi:hypothetical protein
MDSRVQNLLPGYDADTVAKRVSEAWSFRCGFIPWPRFLLRCPCCYRADVQLRMASFGKHPGTIPGRVDVSYKCTRCSFLWTFGVPVSDDIYKRAVKEDGSRSWNWREIQAQLEEAAK